MILNHIWGLYAHPKTEWADIDNRHESMIYGLSHIMLVALIPSICGYFAAAYIGWQIGVGDPITITKQSALMLAISMYVAIMVGIFALAYLIRWMANTFDSNPSFTQCLELAAYTATPVMMAGLAALYPVLWFVALVGCVAVAYSVYLLYSGIPIMMHIPEEKGFIYSSSIVTVGLVLLVCILAGTAIMWTNFGFIPTFKQ
ncbi:Yip1 family protein [Thalassotalea maritima]|uniref:Yip1 family protein n=1 Tax=Thalassotalea maritima TaxID=3242416 RepID=UPI003529A3A9